MLTTSTIKDRIERHDVVFITNQNYDKIRERNKTTIIRFHKKNSAKFATTARAYTYTQVCLVNCNIKIITSMTLTLSDR